MSRARSESRSQMMRLRDGKKFIAENAVKRLYKTKQAFVDAIQPSRTTVWRFFSGEPISLESFEAVCLCLDLDMYDVGEEIMLRQVSSGSTVQSDDAEYVNSIREQVYPKIKDMCGTIQLIGPPIPISRYIDLSIFQLDDMLTQRYESPEILSSDFALANYNRDLGIIRYLPRISGQNAVNEYPYMLIYGWPGFGKTSYLKWLATQCNEGDIFSDLVPIFLKARNFFISKEEFDLSNLISKFIEDCGLRNGKKITLRLLRLGKIMLFLDGLDELSESDSSFICSSISKVVDQYFQCRFVFSCRLPLILQFPRFQKFLVYGFDREQREKFAREWFTTEKNSAELLSSFKNNLKRHKALSELTRTPLLMDLLCRVFKAKQKFPPTRADLYRIGIGNLLYREPSQSNNGLFQKINRDTVWQFLRQIAADFFIRDDPQVLLDRWEVLNRVEKMFSPMLRQNLDLDSSTWILSRIELSYGLLVTYSANFCAFSHLTFQEYFTADYLVRSEKYEIVFEHVTDPKWRFIIELVAELLPAEKKLDFFEKFKYALDLLVIDNNKLCNFLRWVDWTAGQVLDTVEATIDHKRTLLRAWYFVFALKDVYIASNPGKSATSFFVLPDFDMATSTLSSATLDAHIDLYRAFHATRTDRYREFERAVPKIRGALREIAHELDDTLLRLLHQLDTWETVIEKQKSRFSHPITWWESNRDYWCKSICYVMETLHGLQGDWQFSEEEEKSLILYYQASRLLSICTVRAVQNLPHRQQKQVAESLLSIPFQENNDNDEFEGFR